MSLRPWLTRARRHDVAVRAASRRIRFLAVRRRLARLRERGLQLPPRYVYLVDGRILLTAWAIMSIWHPRPITTLDLTVVALTLLLSLRTVEIPGWLRWAAIRAWARYFVLDLHGGQAGSRWKHFRCRLDGHVQADGYWWCSRCRTKVELKDAAVGLNHHLHATCRTRLDRVEASSHCTVCGDDLSPDDEV